jgi:xylulokinase
MFTSAVSIFSAGTSFSWVMDNICSELTAEAKTSQKDVYSLMNQEAEKAPLGSNKLLFNPSLAGGTSQDASVHIRGAYIGLDLKDGKPERNGRHRHEPASASGSSSQIYTAGR